MAIDQFHWHIQVDSAGDVQRKARVRSVEFGDGVEQVASDGLNPVRITYPLAWKGTPEDVENMRDFLEGHYVKAFVFTPPGEKMGLYRVEPDSVVTSYISSRVRGIRATLKQAYGIYGA